MQENQVVSFFGSPEPTPALAEIDSYSGPAVAGANATRPQPIYRNWRQQFRLLPRAAFGPRISPRRQLLPPNPAPRLSLPPNASRSQSFPQDTPTRPNHLARTDWRSESSMYPPLAEESFAESSQTPTPRPLPAQLPQANARPRASSIERDERATGEEYRSGLQAVAEFLVRGLRFTLQSRSLLTLLEYDARQHPHHQPGDISIPEGDCSTL